MREIERAVETRLGLTRLAAAAQILHGAGEDAPTAAREVAAALARAGFADPESVLVVYDALSSAWLDGAAGVGAELEPPPCPPPPTFWKAFWRLTADAALGMEAGEITARTAALGALLHQDYATRAAAQALSYPGVAEIGGQRLPPRFHLEALKACPSGSLGGAFCRLIVDNGFDLEVLDRDALDLDSLPPPLPYLNARILQCHDLWHLTAGYETTKLHEVAISAFQLAQFGHAYSAMFLAVAATAASAGPPEALGLLLEVVCTAWRHGRATPPLIGVDWEAIWARPIAEVRRMLGVAPYPSPYPANLFEALEAAA